MNKFCGRLRELRRERGLTQKELASAVGTTEDCIFFWEKGRSEPSIDEILLLSEFFGVSTDYLLGRTDY